MGCSRGGWRAPPDRCMYSFRSRRLRDMRPKPYEFIGVGDIHGPRLYEFIRFGDIHGPKPYTCIGFGDIHGSKPSQGYSMLREIRETSFTGLCRSTYLYATFIPTPDKRRGSCQASWFVARPSHSKVQSPVFEALRGTGAKTNGKGTCTNFVP